MNEVLKQISDRINAAPEECHFLNRLLGPHQQRALSGESIVLFGAGIMGGELCSALNNHGIFPVCFCDNEKSKIGTDLRGLPIITFAELNKKYKKSLILVSTKSYAHAIKRQLLDNDFSADNVSCNEFNISISTYITDGTQVILEGLKQYGGSKEIFNELVKNEQKVAEVYYSLADQKSKDLYIAKLAYLVCNDNMQLLEDFMVLFSEPFIQFGSVPSKELSECYFYFTNDVITLKDGEIVVDVGAYDGDSVEAFISACIRNNIKYEHIYAFEPDPINYKELKGNTSEYVNLDCIQLGLWSKTKTLPFITSDKACLASSSEISESGNSEINVVSLDDFLQGKEVTFIKMDPPGLKVICESLNGAIETIVKYKPKLAIGAYHSLESIFEIPLLIKNICPEYKLYLRHHSWCLNETDLLAFV